MRLRSAVLTIAGTLVLASPAAAAKAPKLDDLMRDYSVTVSLKMKSDFQFSPDPTGCIGQKPSGWSGAGQEVMEMKTRRPVRVTLYTPSDTDASLHRKDLKGSGFELVGESRRTGQMTHVVCGESKASGIEGCTGRHAVRQKVDLRFHRGKVQFSGDVDPTTREAIPSCDDHRFDWDGAVARTGVIMLETAEGRAPRSKLKTKGSFSLTGTHRDACDVEHFGVGSCSTVWTYKATFNRVKKKAKRRR